MRNESATIALVEADILPDVDDILHRDIGGHWALEIWCIPLEAAHKLLECPDLVGRHCFEYMLSVKCVAGCTSE